MQIIKNLLSWIFSIIIAAIIFCIAIIFIPMQTHTTQKIELTYIFVDDDGSEYKILENGIHGSADDWSFLFKNDDKESNTGEIDENTGYLDNKDYVLNDNSLEEILDENIDLVTKDSIDENINNIPDIEAGKNIIQEKLDEIKDDCITPWDNVIKDGEYVLAYQQRADVPTICNVQKRSCNDGELKGTYTQASCREDIKYEYTKVKVISFNNKEPGELIQTPESAKNDSAIFDTDGKIDGTSEGANTNWNNTHNQPIVKDSTTNLTHKNYYNCMTPWGEVVGHGQFVKAYTSPLGFVDQKCQVELRLCLDGVLKGQSSYNTCEYKDVTYLDYLGGNDDVNQVTPEEIIDGLVEDDGGLFGWFGNLFN